ncbi:MAG TPA: bifunctional pyr operon transcriptional regulator/uracil phosphoribosyltransferase PyrR [Candidatus Dormibacteraeota bacterium]
MLQTPPAKAVILDAEGVRRAWRRIAHEIIERQPNLAQLSLLGIVTRGLPLAQRLAATLEQLEGVRLPVIALDVRPYRDDLPKAFTLMQRPSPAVGGEQGGALPAAAVDGRPVLLVDDVLFNGRTVRAAIDAVIEAGRPTQIQLAVLVDRGHRELPIRPDYIGKNVPTSRQEWVEVHLSETDGEDSVRILERSDG